MKEEIEKETAKEGFTLFPNGHFYSPIPDLNFIKKYEQMIWTHPQKEFLGVNLNLDGQLQLLAEMGKYYDQIPFSDKKVDRLRYFYDNDSFSYSDSIILYSMIRIANPKNIIEVGGGYSSCVTLDTNELFFDSQISFTIIEPYPELVLSLIKKTDVENIQILPMRLQDVALTEFDLLEENDILFIDSTHVSKIYSDVNYIFFNILPRLKKGVIVHFHDIFYPFEYPKDWVYGGRAWNECYLLRAFLEYNSAFKILYFNNFIGQFYQDYLKKYLPLCLNNIGGSIWLMKSET